MLVLFADHLVKLSRQNFFVGHLLFTVMFVEGNFTRHKYLFSQLQYLRPHHWHCSPRQQNFTHELYTLYFDVAPF